MGCLTKIELETANRLIAQSSIYFEQLDETVNGITDSTYIGTDKNKTKYILKIYEHSNTQEVQSEMDILNHLNNIQVPQVLTSKMNYYDNKPVVLYSFIEGKISKQTTAKQLEQIALFLSNMHQCNYQVETKNIYTKVYMQSMIEKTAFDKEFFESYYNSIKDIELTNNALIHGDLFPDNAKFIDERLSGVYDFGQSCYGNRYFDIAVVLVSWCFESYAFNQNFANAFLDIYNKQMSESTTIQTIKPYMLYACLYYALQRYTRVNNVKDYAEFIDKFDILDELL